MHKFHFNLIHSIQSKYYSSLILNASLKPLLAEEPSNFKLSPSQDKLLTLLKTGKNVYFSGNKLAHQGKAGSGKTEVLQRFIKHLRAEKTKVGITAPTGVAASLVIDALILD